jgi:hypothetical protein
MFIPGTQYLIIELSIVSPELTELKRKGTTMKKNHPMRNTLIIVAAIVGLFLAYKLLFIRTVSYEMGGIKIPSKYNILTGKVKPIKDYKGGEIKRVVEDRNVHPKDVGLSADEVMSAKVRWAVFESWVKERPQYKGWEADQEIFKKAQDDFLKEMESTGRKVTIIR